MSTLNDAFPDGQDRNSSMPSRPVREAGEGNAALDEAMKREKINWYREVLELEPGSKVFLPFSRLLVEQGYCSEAVKVLRQGLEQHPEFIEARLLLIDVLHKGDNPAECGAEVARLAVLFREYPGFWDAWSELSAADGSQADLSASLGLLGAMLRNSRVTLAEVLSAGLRAIQRSASGSAAGSLPEENVPQPRMAPAAEHEAEEAEKDEPGLPDETGEAPAALVAAGEVPGQEEEADATPPSTMEDSCSMDPAEEFLSVEGQKSPEAALDAALDVALDAAIDAALDAASGWEPGEMPESAPGKPEPELAALREAARELNALRETPGNEDGDAADVAACAEISPAEAESVETATSGDGSGDPAMPEGKCSLRTRSMAEVLAEQGDIRGAIDIYEELAVSALPEDLPAIYRRLESLRAILGGAPVSPATATAQSPSVLAPASVSSSSSVAPSSVLSPVHVPVHVSGHAAGPDAASAGSPPRAADASSSRGILDMLEKLAVRLENRAR